MDYNHVLVTGATDFIGAHIVDQLLTRGMRVRGTTRTAAKGQRMKDARPQHASLLDFVQIEDFTGKAEFTEAVKDVDGIVHAASVSQRLSTSHGPISDSSQPLNYDTKDNEKELLLPAIAGVKAILRAAASTGKVKRIVLTSSFASVIDVGKKRGPGFTYTGADWNPLTYAEAAAPSTSAVVAYRGSKLFAEREAWNFVEREKPTFDLVTLCPPMTFGPVAHPVDHPKQLNESNAKLWEVAAGCKTLPEARVPVWIDVRDLAKAHVECLLRAEVGMKRYTPASPEKFSYELVASILRKRYPQAREQVLAIDDAPAPEGYDLDWEAVRRDLGVEFHSFQRCVLDLFEGLKALDMKPWD